MRDLLPRAYAGRFCSGLALLTLVACSAIEHGMQARELAGRPLSLQHAEGAARLRAEAGFDPSVAGWLAREGQPDYLYVESRARLYLFYLAADRVVMFERDLAESRVTDLGRTPGSLLRLLPASAREALVARRQQAKRRAKAAHARDSRARPTAPAARAGAGAYFGAFDLEVLARRMREKHTAADPGVEHWRWGALQDGRKRLTASLGPARYEIRSDAVSVAAPAGAATRSLPKSLRVGLHRINRAVFPHKGQAVTQALLPLAQQVLADPSGRTRVVHRLEGRTFRIERHPAQNLVVYSVHP